MITLQKAGMEDAKTIHAMQVRAFQSLLERYHDDGTSPAAEPLERVEERLRDEKRTFYFLVAGKDTVGGIRIQEKEDCFRLGLLFVLPEFQGRGYAQEAVRLAEELYPQARRWELDTILEEERLCHLYEKLGYHKTGEVFVLHPGMTLINYEKVIGKDEENGNL